MAGCRARVAFGRVECGTSCHSLLELQVYVAADGWYGAPLIVHILALAAFPRRAGQGVFTLIFHEDWLTGRSIDLKAKIESIYILSAIDSNLRIRLANMLILHQMSMNGEVVGLSSPTASPIHQGYGVRCRAIIIGLG